MRLVARRTHGCAACAIRAVEGQVEYTALTAAAERLIRGLPGRRSKSCTEAMKARGVGIGRGRLPAYAYASRREEDNGRASSLHDSLVSNAQFGVVMRRQTAVAKHATQPRAMHRCARHRACADPDPKKSGTIAPIANRKIERIGTSGSWFSSFGRGSWKVVPIVPCSPILVRGLLRSPTNYPRLPSRHVGICLGRRPLQDHIALIFRARNCDRSIGSSTYSTRRMDSGTRSRYLCAIKLAAQVCCSVTVGIPFDVCQTRSGGSRARRMQKPGD